MNIGQTRCVKLFLQVSRGSGCQDQVHGGRQPCLFVVQSGLFSHHALLCDQEGWVSCDVSVPCWICSFRPNIHETFYAGKAAYRLRIG